MIPRIRPYFTDNYFNAFSSFDPDISRSEYSRELSKALQNYYPKAKKFGFFNYGRTSLGVGLDVLNIRKNDEIIVPDFTCSTILDPILKRGIIPKLVDINFDFSMDINQVKSKITQNTKAILVTHFFGIPANLLEIKKIANTHNLNIIEDCAHTFCHQTAHGPGSIGDIAFTSLGNDKPLSIGNGSVLILNNIDKTGILDNIMSTLPIESEYNEKCSFLSLACFQYATDPIRYNAFIGVYDFYLYIKNNPQLFQSNIDSIIQNQKIELIFKNFKEDRKNNNHFNNKIQKIYNFFKRITNLQPFEKIDPKLMNSISLHLLLKTLSEMDQVNKSRIKKGRQYIDNLCDNTDLIIPQSRYVPYLRYSILCKKPEYTPMLLKKLRSKNFEVGNFNWGQPLSKILRVKEKFETSEYICKNIVNLPCYPSLNDIEIDKITQILKKFVN